MRVFRELNDNSDLFSPDRLEAMIKPLDQHVRSLGLKIKKLQAERAELQMDMMNLLMSRKRSIVRTSPFESGLEDVGWASNLSAPDVRRSDIPWHVMVTYPKDWKDITIRRKPRVEGWQTQMSREARKLLDTTVSKLDFEDMELSQVMQFMRDVSGANIHVKWRALALASIEPASSVDLNLSNVSFRKSLEAILKDVGGGKLDYIVDEGVVVISTREDFDRRLSLAVYDIRDIIVADRNPAFGLDWRLSPADRARAVAGIMSGVTRIVGRVGAVVETRGLLVVSQPRSNHEKILDLLNGIRKEKGLKPAGAPSLEDRRFGAPADPIVGKLLDQKVSKLDFEDMELSQAMEFMRDVSGANIHVRWRALALESIEAVTTVNVHLSDVTFRKALHIILEDVSTGAEEGVGDTGLGYIIDQGVITVSTNVDLAARIDRRSYDIGDLAEDLDELASVIRKIVDRKSWADAGGDVGTIEQQDARLAISQNGANHAKIVVLLNKLRWARGLKGPVKWTRPDRIAAKSRTKADRIVDKQLDTKVSRLDFEDMEFEQVMQFMRDVSGASIRVDWTTLAKEGIEPKTPVKVHLSNVTFRKALEIVLDDIGVGGEPGTVAQGLGYRLDGGVIRVSTRVALGEVPKAAKRKPAKPERETIRRKLSPAELARKLRFNRGQKTQVASVNLNVDAATANSLGVKFRKGNNDVSYTIVDEAQFRTLMEIDQAGASSASNRVDLNETRQDTIIGTDALLANEMTTYVNRSGDKGNTLDINDNPISFSHEKYVLIDNAGYLTAVKAGQMQHWSKASKDIEFFKAPQTIEIPQVGETVKLEKTLVKPGDEMVVRFDYRWKGK